MKKIWMMLALMLLSAALLVACAKTPDTPGNSTPEITDTETQPSGEDPNRPGGDENPPLNISGNSQAKDDREENRHEPDARLQFQKTGTAGDVMQADFASPDAP